LFEIIDEMGKAAWGMHAEFCSYHLEEKRAPGIARVTLEQILRERNVGSG
jgi:hypothetical protein